ncbi:MAG TPA: hypothetical protein VFP72_06985, partial [Kineosporiaceae bacterium]|nr:hypothetical protein [Kineosporiaceae bacterium]
VRRGGARRVAGPRAGHGRSPVPAGRHAAGPEPQDGLLPLLGQAVAGLRGTLRYRVSPARAHLALAGWAAVWFLIMARHGGVSWHYFVEGGDGLLSFAQAGGGLHLYATNPQLQMGPLTFLVSGVLILPGPSIGLFAAQLVMALGGLLALVVACRLGDEVRPPRSRADSGRRLLLSGLAFVPVWMNLAVRFVHVDDVLALMLAILAVRAVRHRHGLAAGVLIGLSVDAKPWALPFAALLLALPAGDRRGPLLAMAGTVATAWLPFLLADPGTLAATRFTIENTAASTLRTLGVHSAVTPWWDRPAQAALGLLLAGIAVRRGRWAAVVLLATGARVVLDPGSYTYYAAGLAVGALLWDQVGTRRALPVWTWSCASVLFAGRWLPLPPSVHGWTRLVFFLLCVAFLVVPRRALLPRSGSAGPQPRQGGDPPAWPDSGSLPWPDTGAAPYRVPLAAGSAPYDARRSRS